MKGDDFLSTSRNRDEGIEEGTGNLLSPARHRESSTTTSSSGDIMGPRDNDNVDVDQNANGKAAAAEEEEKSKQKTTPGPIHAESTNKSTTNREERAIIKDDNATKKQKKNRSKQQQQQKANIIAGCSSSTLLRQEKQNIAYPKGMITQQGKSYATETSAPSNDHHAALHLFAGAPSMRGIGKNQDKMIHHHSNYRRRSTTTTASHTIHPGSTLRGLGKNDQPNTTTTTTTKKYGINTTPGIVPSQRQQSLTSSPPEQLIPIDRDIVVSPSLVDNNINNTIDRDIVVTPLTEDTTIDRDIVVTPLVDNIMEDNDNNDNNKIIRIHSETNSDDSTIYYDTIATTDDNKNPSYISYLDDGDNDNDDNDGNDNQISRTTTEGRLHSSITQYATTNGVQPVLLGRARISQEEDVSDDQIHLSQEGGWMDSEGGGQPALVSSATTRTLPVPDVDDSELVEAFAVSSTFSFTTRRRMSTAEPVDLITMVQQHAAKVATDKKCKRIACSIVAIACLVLIVSLAVGLTNKKGVDESITTDDLMTDDGETTAPTGSPTQSLPFIKNLELLYNGLPETTKESLYNRKSPQYQAWEWLLNHPTLSSSYPEWRKKQVFAMATIFYSFEGPNWPEESPARSRWMDANTSECSWVMTDEEVSLFAASGIQMFGPDAYEYQVFYPCNADGQLQTLGMHQIFLPPHLKPTIPPEIELLTSLKLLGIAFSQISGAKLSDWFIPELIQLPNLQGLNFRRNGAHGTIPKEISLVTGLRHLLIGANSLTGTIPSEIARMTSLEYLNVGDEEGITGPLPSELGLMTTLTGLSIYRNSITGTVPTELGSLTRLRTGFLDDNQMSGTIPSELGLWTNVIELNLGNDSPLFQNNFTGNLPRELWSLNQLEYLRLAGLPNLHGRIPSEMMMPNLTVFSISGSPHITGTIPDQACLFVDQLDFDCSDLLCGCDCLCAGDTNETKIQS